MGCLISFRGTFDHIRIGLKLGQTEQPVVVRRLFLWRYRQPFVIRVKGCHRG